MQTIGLVGGMSWESTSHYYSIINEEVARRLGGYHSAKIALVSVDFHEVEALQAAGAWDESGRIIADAAEGCVSAGADFVVMCTNTMHLVLDLPSWKTAVPFLHIADATGERVRAVGVQTVGLLGTRFTMEEPFYRERLEQRHGLRVIVPDAADREIVHRVIYDELVHGMINEESRGEFRRVIASLADAGAQGVIEGCTEIGLLVRDKDSSVPLFDTTRIHAIAAVDRALAS